MTERKEIGWRLENWAKWATAHSARGADSMTGAICESMRKAAQGELGPAPRDDITRDDHDAVRIEIGMRKLLRFHRLLLHWCYIEQARPEIVCRKLSIPVRPASEFVAKFHEAQAAIEDAANDGNK